MKSPFLHIVKKELIIMTRNRTSLAFMLILPVLFIYIFNKIVSTDMNHIDVMAVVQKPSEYANQFLQPLRENPIFRYKGTITSVDEGMSQLRRGEVHALIVLGKDFDKRADALTSETLQQANNAVVQILTDNSNLIIGNTANYYIRSALTPQQSSGISTKMLYNPGLYSSYQLGVGLFALLLIYISITSAASGMVKERECNSIDAIIMSPVTTWKLALGKMCTSLMFNCIIAVLGLIITHYLINVPIRGSFILVVIISLLCIVTTLLLGTFISLSSATESNALSTATMVVVLPIFYFSGLAIPPEGMPDWAQFMSKCLYARWVIDALRKVMLQGAEFPYIIKELSIVLTNMLVFLLLCIYKLKNDRWIK